MQGAGLVGETGDVIQTHIIQLSQPDGKTEGNFPFSLFIIGVSGLVHSQPGYQLILGHIMILPQIPQPLIMQIFPTPLSFTIDKIPHLMYKWLRNTTNDVFFL